MNSHSQPDSQPIQAAFWMLGAVFSFSAMAVAGREMAIDLDTFEIMTYRSIIGLIIVLVCAWAFGTLHQINTDRLGVHFLRNIFHFTGQNLWFFAVTLIPFAQLFAFEFSTPIWIAIAAPFFLGERLSLLRKSAIFMGFAGILMVTRPWLAGLSPGLIAAALCAIGFAGAAIFTKRLTRTASITCILFWLTSMQLVFGLICIFADGQIALPTRSSIGWVFVVGLGGLIAHFCITKALTLAPATIVTPVDFTRLPIIVTIGYLFYNEGLDTYVILGAVIIFAANYINILAETRTKTKPA